MLPCTTDQFFDVFTRYNVALWPAPLVLLGLALLIIALALSGSPRATLVGAGLAAFWGWMAVAYHFAFFAAINPAAWLFGTLFLAAAALFLWSTWKGHLRFDPPRGIAGIASAVLLMYALIGYPLLGWVVGHTYPRVPTFGLPCPTTIFTLGLLLLARRPVPKAVLVVPMAWSIIGSFAAFRFGVVQDYGLLAAGVITGAVLTSGPRSAERKHAQPVA